MFDINNTANAQNNRYAVSPLLANMIIVMNKEFRFTYIASDIGFVPQHAGSKSSVQHSSPVLQV